MKIETIIKNSIKELKNIKKYATKKEIRRLLVTIDSNHFNGKNHSECIYGSMTGSCYNDRANFLIEKCASLMKVRNGQLLLGETIEFKRHKARKNSINYHSQLELLAYNYYNKTIELVNEHLR